MGKVCTPLHVLLLLHLVDVTAHTHDTRQRHGSGRLEYFNGNVYDGAWQEDMRHGYGTLTYATGEVYEGAWANDKKGARRHYCGGGEWWWWPT